MEDVKKEIHLHHEEKTSKDGKVQTLKDQVGNVKFIKIGFNGWEKVEVTE
jgi:hypothetical protein